MTDFINCVLFFIRHNSPILAKETAFPYLPIRVRVVKSCLSTEIWDPPLLELFPNTD